MIFYELITQFLYQQTIFILYTLYTIFSIYIYVTGNMDNPVFRKMPIVE
jgi:hypothetical protein